MLDFASMLKGIKPAPIPDHAARPHYLDRHPPHRIDEDDLFDDESGGKAVPLKRRMVERQRIVHMIIAESGEWGTYLAEIGRQLPKTGMSKIEYAIRHLLKQGKIRASERRAGTLTRYWDAAQ